MTEQDLAAIEARLQAVTMIDALEQGAYAYPESEWNEFPNPEEAFIGHAHADIAALLDEMRRKTALESLGRVFLLRLEKELGHELTADEIVATMLAAGVAPA